MLDRSYNIIVQFFKIRVRGAITWPLKGVSGPLHIQYSEEKPMFVVVFYFGNTHHNPNMTLNLNHRPLYTQPPRELCTIFNIIF